MAAGDIVVINESARAYRGNYFDGTDDYVLHDAHAVARVAANDTKGTYSAWIYPDAASANNTVILSAGDNNSATEYFKLFINNNILKASLYHGNVTQWTIQETTGSLVPRKWIHVTLVQTGTRPDLYVNGKKVAITDSVSTDLTMWYDELTGCDKFAVGVIESNGSHLQDFKGAIGQVKYWNRALTADEVYENYKGNALSGDGTYLQLNVTMENDGTTDSGLGADNGTLTGHAYYGGEISDWSYKLNANSSGHAAEFINTLDVGQGRILSILKKGD